MGEHQINEVHRLHLTDVAPSPDLPWTRPPFPVFAYLVLAAGGPVLIDSGVGIGHDLIDELYAPTHHDLDDALGRHGVAVADVTTVITSHLHFDHCGQNGRFVGAEIVVQRAEAEAAEAEHYTVPEWAFPPGVELTLLDGDREIAPGIRVVATPGHTPGHQSVVIDGAGGTRTIVCCQASWDVASYAASSLGDQGWDDAAGAASVARLHALDPDRVLLSHDPEVWLRGPR